MERKTEKLTTFSVFPRADLFGHRTGARLFEKSCVHCSICVGSDNRFDLFSNVCEPKAFRSMSHTSSLGFRNANLAVLRCNLICGCVSVARPLGMNAALIKCFVVSIWFFYVSDFEFHSNVNVGFPTARQSSPRETSR
jgi:hypothetical protein